MIFTLRILALSIIVLLTASPAYATPDNYEILDGPTAPVGAAPSISSVSAAATETETPEETEEGVAYDPVSRTPPCANSTCITAQTIANAKHAFVSDSPVKSYISLLSPPDGGYQECQAPTKTGLTVHRLVVEGEVAYIDKYDDAFCINQGCVYFGFIGDERCE